MQKVIRAGEAEEKQIYLTQYKRKVEVVKIKQDKREVILNILSIGRKVEVPFDYQLFMIEKEKEKTKKKQKVKLKEVKVMVHQEDVYNTIKKEKEISATLLAEKLGIQKQNVFMKARKLLEKGVIKKVKPGVFAIAEGPGKENTPTKKKSTKSSKKKKK